MRYDPDKYKTFTIVIDKKQHEDLKIRLYYDGVKSQTGFIQMCLDAYVNQDKLFLKFFDEYREKNKVQSKNRINKAKDKREKGNKLLEDLALTEEDIEDIFDIIAGEVPEI